MHVGIWFNPFAIKLNKLANNNKEQGKGEEGGKEEAGTGKGRHGRRERNANSRPRSFLKVGAYGRD